MKAVVQKRYGSPEGLVLCEVERPAVADDRVLVRVRAASVNASDWHLMRRLPHLIGKLLRMPSSRVRGGDMSGQVEAVGRSVTGLKPGDEVFGSGIGSFAEYATAFEDRLAPKPRNLSFAQAAAIPGAGCTALQGLRDKGRVEPGQRVLIYGAGGGVGTFAVQIAKAFGAHVTAVSSAGNLDLLSSIGADEVIDYGKEDFTKRTERYDVLFDVGADRSFAECRRVLVPNGRCVLVGAPAAIWKALWRLLEMQLLPHRDTGRVTLMTRLRHDDLVVLKDLAEAGKIRPVIDREYPLSGTADAIRYVGTRRVRGKVVIVVS